MRLVVVQGTRVDELDVDTGRRVRREVGSLGEGYDRLNVERVGDRLVVIGDNSTGAGQGAVPVHVVSTDFRQRRRVGSSEHIQASSVAGRVWLVTCVEAVESHTTLAEVDALGRVHRRARFPDCGVRPIGHHFIRDRTPAAESTYAIVDTRDRVLRDLGAVWVAARGVSAAAVVAPNCNPCEAQLVTDGSAPVRHVTLPLDLRDGLVTPDGLRILGTVSPWDDSPWGRTWDIDVASGTATEIVGASSSLVFGPSFTFSRDGRWMFFIDGDGSHVVAYNLATRSAYRVPGANHRITQLVAL